MSDGIVWRPFARPEWMQHGECHNMGPALFYPEGAEGLGERRDICASCPVCDECREWAVANNELGWWGGTSERERDHIRYMRDRRMP